MDAAARKISQKSRKAPGGPRRLSICIVLFQKRRYINNNTTSEVTLNKWQLKVSIGAVETVCNNNAMDGIK